jgi:hypothetical protein
VTAFAAPPDSAAAWALGAAAPPDEFDLDVRFETVALHGFAHGPEEFLPTAGEVPGQTCDTHAGTCPPTCQPTCAATCPGTCAATCPDTCKATCAGTCHATCRATCQVTCRASCADLRFSCGGSCANTHCFTCRSGCQIP